MPRWCTTCRPRSKATTAPDETVWVIGGGQVYAAALDRADVVSETVIDVDVPGDTVAPTLDETAGWTLTDEGPWQESRNGGTRYRFLEWQRRALSARTRRA
ncbi:dihydrofolate reductase [Curtobacterium flaccumfaciens]|nr:dihydrofolate reductase [Curtobacterium flaccumfaciens]